MILISSSLALSPGFLSSANNPVIGWRNLATVGNIVADTQDASYPASNLANPSTNLRWLAADTSEQHITISVNSVEPLDYLAVARHNFGTAQIAVSVEGTLDAGASTVVWQELVSPAIPADDGPLIFRFAPFALDAIRLKLQTDSAAPTAAVIYTGALLVLQRRIYVGHTPIPYGRKAKITNARSESGNFLGRIVLNEMTETAVSLQNLDPNWYRSQLDPFIRASKEVPFFFAWRPGDYPSEVGYAWIADDPQPSNQRSNGMMSIDFKMTGISA